MSAAAPSSVIVVGAGSAGSVIARRLVDAGVHVTLIEGGGPAENPAISDPARMGELWHGPEDWDYYTIPQPHAGNRRLHLPRGKVLGGSHALNAMIWVRGLPQDFDDWGVDGWSWADVEPVYRAIENVHFRAGAPDPTRGTDGPLDVTDTPDLAPIQESIITAAVESGLPRNEDYNSGSQEGVSQQQVTARDGHRLMTYNAYLEPVVDSSNLTVLTRSRVNRLLFADTDPTRVIGVEIEHDGRITEVFADEVVLSAGALDSPRVLLLSGIGDEHDLAEAGIASRKHLPGVGRNLHDHLLAPVIFTTERRVGPPQPGCSPTQAHLFWKSRPDLDRPDTQPLFFSVPMYQDDLTGPDDGFSLMAGIVTPKSRGRLALRSADPHDEVDIDLAALQEQEDVDALVASVEQCRGIGKQHALQEWGAAELYPGTGTDVETYVRNNVVTYHHQVGTCAMGTDDQSVVDPQLRVHGIAGLRVADASIMPTITTGNTNAPSVMIGEKAAALVLGG